MEMNLKNLNRIFDYELEEVNEMISKADQLKIAQVVATLPNVQSSRYVLHDREEPTDEKTLWYNVKFSIDYPDEKLKEWEYWILEYRTCREIVNDSFYYHDNIIRVQLATTLYDGYDIDEHKDSRTHRKIDLGKPRDVLKIVSAEITPPLMPFYDKLTHQLMIILEGEDEETKLLEFHNYFLPFKASELIGMTAIQVIDQLQPVLYKEAFAVIDNHKSYSIKAQRNTDNYKDLPEKTPTELTEGIDAIKKIIQLSGKNEAERFSSMNTILCERLPFFPFECLNIRMRNHLKKLVEYSYEIACLKDVILSEAREHQEKYEAYFKGK